VPEKTGPSSRVTTSQCSAKGDWASLGPSVAGKNGVEGFSWRREFVYWQPRKAEKEMSGEYPVVMVEAVQERQERPVERLP